MYNKCINDWVKVNLISVAKKIGYAFVSLAFLVYARGLFRAVSKIHACIKDGVTITAILYVVDIYPSGC